MARSVVAGQGLVRVAVVLFCVVCCIGVGVSSASASVSQFGGGEGSGAGQFTEAHGVAMDQESGDVYVVDRNNARIEKFGGEGAFLFAWGWGVADGHTAAAQTCTSTCFRGLEGVGAGQFASPEGVAVDNDLLSSSRGDVYVFDITNLRVEKFDSAGTFLLAFGREVNATTLGDVCLAGESCQAGTRGTGAGEFEPYGGDIAVGPGGTVFVGDEERVQRFTPGGVLEGQIALSGAARMSALAVDSGGDLYVESELGGVRKYDSGGVEVGEPRDASGAPTAIAVGPADELFVDDSPQGSPHHILEFDSVGGEVASFDTGLESGSRGIAFGDGIGGLYVLNGGVVRVVIPPAAGPALLAGSDAASQLQPTTATLSATLNPEGHETSYHFEYGTSIAYGASTPAGTLEGSFEDQPVSASLSGLQPRTTYHFRVVASSSAGTMFGPDETFVTLPPVLIESESVSQVTAGSAALATQINPLGLDTRYRFEYGPTTAYGTSVPVPDEDIGSGTEGLVRSAPIEGLSPSADYHYRVVAYNALGTVEGPDRVFHTQGAQTAGLLDGRAWEMVSPPDKHGAALETIGSYDGGLIQAADDGHAVTYVASAPVEANPRGSRSLVYTQVLSTRGSGGWSSQGIALPNEAPAGFEFKTSEYAVFSEDLSAGLAQPGGFAPLSPAATETTPYLREANGEYTPLVTAANVPEGTKFGGQDLSTKIRFVGASPDLSHVVVSSPQALTQDAVVGTEGRRSLYEWTAGSLQQVSILPNEKPAVEDGAVHGFESFLGAGMDVRHAVSEDGSRVFWTAQGSGLYMRDMGLGRTVQLDLPEEGAQGEEALDAAFEVASRDGSKAFFIRSGKLTKDATKAAGSSDLYMCEVGESAGSPTCKLKDLTVDTNNGEAADVQGHVIGASEDGRYVYFVAAGALTAGAVADGRNLYVYDTVTSTRKLVAVLSTDDKADWAVFSSGFLGELTHLTARVSPNGRYLAFMSQRSITGYDNIDASSGQPDEEVFLYDVSTGRVVCASCNPSGARPTGMFDGAGIPGPLVDRHSPYGSWENHWLAASVPGWNQGSTVPATKENFYQPRYLSDSGRLFFDAADALVPGDTNGTEDVYEYEPGGVGGCAGASGCVGLISSGTSGEESAVIDASASGDDVFFLTASRLASQDVDGSLDVYDARVCSSASPCVGGQSGSAPACSSSDSCRGLSAAQGEGSVAPGSVSVSGAGNLAPPPASRPLAKAKRLTKAQKLASALRSCRRKPKRRRASCVARAHRLYGKGAGASVSRGAGAKSKGNG